MKKIVSIVLAMAMVLSFAGMAFAADVTADVVAVIDGNAPTKAGDIVKVNFVVKNITGNNFTVGKVLFAFNDDVLAQCTKQGYLTEEDDPEEETSLPDDFYKIPKNWASELDKNRANGTAGVSVYSTTYTDGVDVSEDGYVLFTAYFKVLKDNAIAEIKLISEEEDPYGTLVEGLAGKAEINAMAPLTFTIGDAPVVEDVEIVSVAAPETVTVKVNETVTLPETVVGTTADGATVDVAVTWAAVDTSVEGTVKVAGTLTAPEGYVLAENVTVEATVVVEKEETPTDVEIVSVAAPEAVTVDLNGTVTLPETVVGTTADGATVDVAVAWAAVDTSVEGTVKVAGTLTAPEGYVLAEGVTVEVEVTVVKPTEGEGEKNLPVYITATFTPNGANGATIVVNGVANEAYEGTLVVKENLVMAITFKNGKTPLGVIFHNAEDKLTFGVAGDVIPEGTDNVDVSVVQDLDYTQAISETNLGTPVASGYNFVIE